MFMRVSSTLVALALIGFVAGCSDSPVTQYDAGKQALEEARVAGAEQYAPELFKQATDTLNAASVEMQKQDGRFAMFRSYGKAEETILAAQQIAQKAIDEVAVEKERMRQVDSALIAEIESLIAETNKAFATAPSGKGSRVDLKVMRADLDAATVAFAAATEDFKAGDFITANEKLHAIKSQVVKVKSDIDAALARLMKK